MGNRKRRHGSIDSTNQFNIKRLRPIHQQQHPTLNTLPFEHQYIVRQAADILQVPVPNLRSAITELEEDAESLPLYYDWPFSYYPQGMKRESVNGRLTPKTSRAMGLSSERAEADDGRNPYEREKSAQQWKNEKDGLLRPPGLPDTSSQEARDSTFNFPKNIFSEFFSNCCYVDDTPPSRDNGYETGPMLSPASMLGAQPMPSYPNYGTSMTGLPYSYDNGGPNGLPSMSDDGLSMSHFVCDTPEFSGPWMPVPPGNQVQMQPPRQEMTYPQPTDGYTDFNRLYVADRIGGPPILTDSGFVSDTSLSYQRRSETEHDSDSAQSLESGGLPVATVPTRRGPFKSQEDRVQTAQTRKDGCCLRCRHQKIRCIPDPNDRKGVCLTCKNVKAANMKIQKPACIRYKVTDVRLYKIGQVPGLEWSQRWSNRSLKEMTTWANKETITIEVSEGYTATPLKLVVCKFNPVKGDVLQRSWVAYGGVKKTAQIPSFAIKDLSAAKDAYKQYINNGGAEFFKGALDPKDAFLWTTYSMAIATSDNENTPERERRLLKKVLRLWVAIRLNTTSTNIVGSETLGMPRDILDNTHPTPGRIPIPPVMGNQIELILSRDIQDPLRVDILDELQKLIYSNKASCWFTIYLCTFILLHNCAMITKHDASYARKHGIQARFARPAMVAEYHAGATALLAHFHFCNKGSYPFSAEGEKSEVLAAAGLTETQMRFIQYTRNYVISHSEHFEDFRWVDKSDNDHYFIAQLYEQNWKPRIKI